MAKKAAETKYFINKSDLALISKLVLFRESTKKIILSKNRLNIEERQILDYVIHLKESYPFLTVRSDDKQLKISLTPKNFSAATQWLDIYIKNFKNDDLTYEYRYNRTNEDSFSKKISDFTKSIDKTKNLKDYYIKGTSFIEQILALNEEKKLTILTIEINTYSDKLFNDFDIYEEIEVEEVDEVYDVLRDDYLNVEITANISTLLDKPKKSFKKENKTPNVVPKKNTYKCPLSKEEIEILKLRESLEVKTYKNIGKNLKVPISEDNVTQKFRSIKDKLDAHSPDEALYKAKSEYPEVFNE